MHKFHVEQFRSQSTLTGVAQAVVDKIVRIHHDMYMSGVGSENGVSNSQGRRDDITLLVRNFNFPLPHALASPTPVVRFNPNPTVNTIPDWTSSQSELGKSSSSMKIFVTHKIRCVRI